MRIYHSFLSTYAHSPWAASKRKIFCYARVSFSPAWIVCTVHFTQIPYIPYFNSKSQVQNTFRLSVHFTANIVIEEELTILALLLYSIQRWTILSYVRIAMRFFGGLFECKIEKWMPRTQSRISIDVFITHLNSWMLRLVVEEKNMQQIFNERHSECKVGARSIVERKKNVWLRNMNFPAWHLSPDTAGTVLQCPRKMDAIGALHASSFG